MKTWKVTGQKYGSTWTVKVRAKTAASAKKLAREQVSFFKPESAEVCEDDIRLL